MARPKGVIQKRNESKYWLPEGIILQPGQTDIYNKETILIFLDPQYGEFFSSFKALQSANASTHPLSVQARREATNELRFGFKNAGSSPEVRKKAHDTMEAKYGKRNALECPEFLNKSINTLKQNYGISHPMQSKEIRVRQKLSLLATHGVDNPMKSSAVKEQMVKNSQDKYGYDYPCQSPEIKEKICEAFTTSDGRKESEGERELRDYITSLGFNGYPGYVGGSNPKQIDIKIENSSLCFEYNGNYWHSEANKNMHKNYHLEKTIECEKKGLRLIHIFEHEWEERNAQVKSYIRSALGKNSRIVYARKTTIKPVDKKEARDFLEKYHILGATRLMNAYGLYLNDELLCLISVNVHHRNNKELVINRYVGKEDVSVVGGLSKLSSHAKSIHGTLTTWVDRRISDGEGWIKAGWTKISVSKPDYFYYNIKTAKVQSKQSRKKSLVKTPEGMTESQHSLKDGLAKIYDCGKIKLRF